MVRDMYPEPQVTHIKSLRFEEAKYLVTRISLARIGRFDFCWTVPIKK
jgi:hypothetical protein